LRTRQIDFAVQSVGMSRAVAAGTLEGSRLSAYVVPMCFSSCRELEPENVKAGGSRELPRVWLLYRFVKVDLPVKRNRYAKIALGCSREPPVATRFRRINDRPN
jgi:hypothetical protein